MPVAMLQLCIATAAQPDATIKSVRDTIKWDVESGSDRYLALGRLDAYGWKMLKPQVVETDTDCWDIVIYLHKSFATSEEGEDEAEACGCRERENWSFLWNWDGTFNDEGQPNYEWGGECR